MSFKTVSGAAIDFLNPKNIKLDDLALGLSRQPRFAGQTERSYSVAQHCLFVHALAPHLGMYALIHDAQEAFLCDLPTPAKEAMRLLTDSGHSPYDELEERLYHAICKKLDLDPYKNYLPVKRFDIKAREIEVEVLRRGKSHPLLNPILDLPEGGRQAWLKAVKAKELAHG